MKNNNKAKTETDIGPLTKFGIMLNVYLYYY